MRADNEKFISNNDPDDESRLLSLFGNLVYELEHENQIIVVKSSWGGKRSVIRSTCIEIIQSSNAIHYNHFARINKKRSLHAAGGFSFHEMERGNILCLSLQQQQQGLRFKT